MAQEVLARDPRVPYEELAVASERAREVFTDAEEVKAIWTPASEHTIHVEVWTRNERTGACEGRVYAWES